MKLAGTDIDHAAGRRISFLVAAIPQNLIHHSQGWQQGQKEQQK
jgi:hypothetical protein